MTDAQIEAAIFISIALFIWIGALFLISRFSPWHRITKIIGPNLVPPAFGGDQKKFRFVSARIGSAKYKNCLTANFNRYGFGLKVPQLFLPGHPKLFIPWEAIETLSSENFLFMPATRITLKNDSDIEILLYGKMFENNPYVPNHLQNPTTSQSQ